MLVVAIMGPAASSLLMPDFGFGGAAALGLGGCDGGPPLPLPFPPGIPLPPAGAALGSSLIRLPRLSCLVSLPALYFCAGLKGSAGYSSEIVAGEPMGGLNFSFFFFFFFFFS